MLAFEAFYKSITMRPSMSAAALLLLLATASAARPWQPTPRLLGDQNAAPKDTPVHRILIGSVGADTLGMLVSNRDP